MTNLPYDPRDGYTLLRRNLGDHPGRLQFLDLVPLTFGRARVARSDGRLFYGEAY